MKKQIRKIQKCRGPEVVPSSLYQKNIGVEFTHLYKQIKKFWVAGFCLPAINATVFRTLS